MTLSDVGSGLEHFNFGAHPLQKQQNAVDSCDLFWGLRDVLNFAKTCGYAIADSDRLIFLCREPWGNMSAIYLSKYQLYDNHTRELLHFCAECRNLSTCKQGLETQDKATALLLTLHNIVLNMSPKDEVGAEEMGHPCICFVLFTCSSCFSVQANGRLRSLSCI